MESKLDFDAITQRKKIVEWIRGWFEQNGPMASAVIGLSGGKDSSITAALLTEAIGKERVVGVLMPNGIQSDLEDAKEVAKSLGIKTRLVNIGGAVKALTACIEDSTDPLDNDKTIGDKLSWDAGVNLPPRIRMTVLYAVAQSLPNGGRVANTCNASEDYVGYSTKYGDSAGDFSPLADLTVQEVLAVGQTFANLPQRLVKKTPSDGLCGQSDEDRLGFTYEMLDRYIRTGVCEDEKVKEKIDRLHVLNLHKLKVIPKYERTED